MRRVMPFLLILLYMQISHAQKIVILHTNDMHSKITGFGPESAYTPLSINDDKTIGGFARLATLIKQNRNPENTLVVDAGDFLMGTVFQALEPQNGFQLRLMKQMGYDAVTIGNHEFDFGPDKLADIINSAVNNGDIPKILETQMQFSPTNPADDKLAYLVNHKTILPYQIFTKNGLKIGIFGLIGYDAIHVAPNAAPVTFKDAVETARYYTNLLRTKEKANIVVCLSHSGIYPDFKKGGFYGEDIELAKKVPDLDVIISGHSHVETPKQIQQGKTIIVQTGSFVHNLGRLELNYNNGKLSVTNFQLIPVDDKIMGDSTINTAIENYKKQVNQAIFQPLGVDYATPIAETAFDLPRGNYRTKEPGTMGNFVADAIKYYTDTYSTGTDFAMVPEGVIREKFIKGEITPADAFRVSPLGKGKNDVLGYSLAQIYITGYEAMKLLELSVISGKPGDDSHLYFSGIKADYKPKGFFLHKIKKVYINGKPINTSKKDKTLYSVTADTYLLSFIGEVKKMSHGLIKIVPKDANGKPITDINNHLLDFNLKQNAIQEGKEWIALFDYLKSFPDTNNNGISDMPDKYKQYKPYLVKIK